MKRVLIMTVGRGTRPDVDITRPLAKSIENSNPDFVSFVTSQETEPLVEKIIEQLEKKGLDYRNRYHITIVQNHEDVEMVLRDTNKLIASLKEMEYPTEGITVDFTTGTKAMSAGVVLSAVNNACSALKYITGPRRNGIVIDGQERFIAIPIDTMFYLNQLKLAQELIRHYRFDSASAILKEIDSRQLEDYEQKKLKDLHILSSAYSYWDKFDHKRFLQEYKKVHDELSPELEDFKIKELSTFQHLEKISQAIESKEFISSIIADLYNNACRRMEEEKYDDALARLYRLTEMIAQWKLQSQYHIQADNIDIDLLPESMQATLIQNKALQEKKEPLRFSLQKCYTLLAEKGDPLGLSFCQNKRLESLLNERNFSILAHGLKPITPRICNHLKEELLPLLEGEIPDFQQLADILKFPWSA